MKGLHLRPNGDIVADTPDAIQLMQILALKGAVKLETLGLTRSGKTACQIARERFGWTGTKKQILAKLEQYIEDTYGKHRPH